MLDERNEVSESKIRSCQHRAGCTDSNLADGDPGGEGPDMNCVSFLRHPFVAIVDPGQIGVGDLTPGSSS